MSERGPGDDRERLGREPGETGRAESGNPDAEYERGRADAMERQSHEQSHQYPPAGSHTTQSTGTGWGIVALILSILALLSNFVIGPFSLILSMPGFILGIVARRKGSRGLGLASIIISILAILIAVLFIIGLILIVTNPEFQQELQRFMQEVQ